MAKTSQPRQTVVLSHPLIAWLREEAGRLGIPVNELIRRLLDQMRENRSKA